MADLRTLLQQSAPKPTTPLDLAAIHARAQRRPRRRFATWLGIAGLTLGIGIPGGSVLVTADRENDRQADPPSVPAVVTPVRVDGATDATTTTSMPTAPSGATARRATESKSVEAPAARGGSAGSDDNARVVAPPTTSRGSVPTTTTVVSAAPSPTPSDYPQAASCSIDNRGLGRNEQRRCRFTATTSGGASFRDGSNEPRGPTAQVSVTRDGTTTTRPVTGVAVFAGDLGQACAERFIQPGDLVELVLSNTGTDPGAEATIGAGEGWACGSS